MEKDSKSRIALALSGGGFRGVLFHLGGLWRLNELGWLPKIDTISGVSGGAILASHLGLRWRQLRFNAAGTSENFGREIAAAITNLCSRTIDLLPTMLNAVQSVFGASNELVEQAYRTHIFGDATLADLPQSGDGPRIVINACNLKTGMPVRLSRDCVEEPGMGRLVHPGIGVAKAVAASSAFPPFLSPVIIDVPAGGWEGGPGAGAASRKRLVLADGALIDPLGLLAVSDNHSVLIVSDASTMLAPWLRTSSNWFRQLNRAILVQCDASSILQRDALVRALRAQNEAAKSGGAYWCNAGRIGDFGANATLASDTARTMKLGVLRTRLNGFSPAERGRLINWGYAMCDAAMRHYGLSSDAGGRLPMPDYEL